MEAVGGSELSGGDVLLGGFSIPPHKFMGLVVVCHDQEYSVRCIGKLRALALLSISSTPASSAAMTRPWPTSGVMAMMATSPAFSLIALIELRLSSRF